MSTRISRRDLFRYAAVAGSAAAVGALLSACGGTKATTGTASVAPRPSAASGTAAPFQAALPVPGVSGLLGVLDAANAPIPITTTFAMHAILPGKDAQLSVYKATKGDMAYINPIFRMKTGDAFNATLTNNLGEPTNIHWHGLKVEARQDGHPSLVTANGQSFPYRFTLLNRSGMYWYHPHPEGATAKQAYNGLAGLFIVEDDDELALQKALDLQFGVTDIPLILQDKQFSASGQPIYAPQAMDQQMGFLGDVPLVNLTPSPYFNAQTRLYRFRVLNGSNARTFRLAFAKGNQLVPYTIIGTDGGLLGRPVNATEVFISSGERVDLLLDLRSAAVGDAVTVQSLAFDPMENEMSGGGNMGGMSGMGGMGTTGGSSSKLPNGAAMSLMKINVTQRVAYDRAIPDRLSTIAPIATAGAAVRPVTLSQAMMSMQWLINGTSYKAGESPIAVRKGATEVWEIQNAPMSMPHPMHIHGFPFQVIERRNSPQQVAALTMDGSQRLATDLGWKDTVLVWPNETVRIAVDFTHPFTGEQKYVFHCHILEHEENGMMVNTTVA